MSISESKKLWVMRHGLAQAEFESDFSRALSDVGKAQARDVARQIKNSGEPLPVKMLVSPFKRTQQTASIVHQELGLVEPFETEEMLVHFADHQLLGDFLLASEFHDLMIVSHMPIVARLCQYLSPGCGIYGFNTAQTVRLCLPESGEVKVEQNYLPESAL